MAEQHTQGLWVAHEPRPGDKLIYISGPQKWYPGKPFVFVDYDDSDSDEMWANAQRLVACVNALAGLNPEIVDDMVKVLEFVVREGREVCSVMSAAVLTKARRQKT